MKTGVYMGPTGNLVTLDTAENFGIQVKEDVKYVLNTYSEDGGTYFLPGVLIEFKTLLAGFTYLGKL